MKTEIRWLRYMRLKIILLTMWSFLALVSCTGDDPRIQQIDSEVRGIDAEKTSMNVTEVQLSGYAIEGGLARVYRKKSGDIRLIEVEQHGEAGLWQEWIYFNATGLIYIRAVEEALNNGEYIVLEDGTRTPPSENRYYFQKDLLIHWIDSEHNPVDPGSDEFLMMESDYRDYVGQLMHDVQIEITQ